MGDRWGKIVIIGVLGNGAWAAAAAVPSGPAPAAVGGFGIPGIACAGLAAILAVVTVWLALRNRKLQDGCRLLDALPVRVTLLDRDGHILFFHRESGVACVIDPEDRFAHVRDLPWVPTETLLEQIRSVYDSGTPKLTDYDCYGERRSLVLVRSEGIYFGRTVVIAVSSDSNVLQTTRAAAEAAAQRFALTLQAIGDAVIVTDTEEKVTMMNPVAAALTGYAEKEAIGRSLDDIFRIVSYVDDLPVPSPVREALTSGEIVSLANHTDLIACDGTRLHIADSAAPIRNRAGAILGAILVFRDVTREYRQRDELNSTMALLEQLSSSTEIGFFRTNLKTMATESLLTHPCRFVPREGGECLPPEKWIFPEDLAAIHAQIREVIAGKCNEIAGVLRSNYTGRLQYLQIQATAVRDGSGATVRDVIGLVRDITVEMEQKKQHENALSLLQTITASIPYPIFIKAIEDNFRYVSCNRTFAGHMGRSVDEVVGHTDFELMPDAAAAEQMRAHDREVVKNNRIEDWPEEYRTAAGELYRCRSIKQVITGVNGEKLLLGISIDVTGEEKARREAQDKEELLRNVLDGLPVGIFAKDVSDQFRFLLWNRRSVEFTGKTAEEILGRRSDEIGLPPEQALEVIRRDRAVAEEGQEACERQTLCDASGKEMVLDVYRVPCQVAGRPVLLGMVLDVTERCRLEMERAARIESLEFRVRHLQVINDALQLLTREAELDKSVYGILELYCRHLGADRGSVYKCTEEGFAKEFLWSSNGEAVLDNYSHAELDGWLARCRADRPVIISDTMNPPADLRGSADALHAGGIRSLIAVAIPGPEGVYGFLGFDFITKSCELREEDADILRNAVSLYRLARERSEQMAYRKEQSLLQAEMFKQIDMPMVVVDTERVVRAVNSSFGEVWPIGSADIIGKHCYDENVCGMRHTDYCAPDHCVLWQTVLGQKPISKVRSINGRQLQIQSKPLRNADGESHYVIETIVDVSDIGREQRELSQYVEQDRLIQGCLEMVVMEADFSKVCNRLTTMLSEFFLSASVGIMRREMVNGVPMLKAVADWMPCASPRHEKDVQSIPEERIRSGADVLRKGLAIRYRRGGDSSLPKSLQRDLNHYLELSHVAEIIMVPVFCRGNWWGYVVAEREDSGVGFSESEERAFRGIARVLEILLAREEQKRLLADQAWLHSQIFEKVRIPEAMVDTERKVIAINPSCCSLLHVEKEKVVGSCCHQVLCGVSDEESCTAENCPIVHTLETGEGITVDSERNGVSLRLQTQPILNAEGSLQYVLESIVDTSRERDRNQELSRQREELALSNTRLRQYVDQDRTITACMEIMVMEEEFPVALHQIVTKIGPTLNSDNCAVYRFEPENARCCLFEVWTAPDANHNLNELPVVAEQDFPQAIAALKSGLPIHMLLESADESAPWHKEAAGYLTTSHQAEIVMVPIMIKEGFWGYFGSERNPRNAAFGSAGVRMVASAAHVIEVLLERETHRKVLQSMRRRLKGNPAPLRVLIVDDVALNLKVLTAMLKKLDCEVRSASSGKEALALLDQFFPDMILSDLWMPEMDGAEFAGRVRKRPGGDAIRLVAVTADAECCNNFDMSCFEEIIYKPVTGEMLNRLIQALRIR